MKQFLGKKILIISTSDSGGAGTAVYRILLGLNDLGYDTKLLVKDQDTYLEQCQLLIEQKDTLALISKFMVEIDSLLKIESQYGKI
jgi:hypothetical protein